MKAEPAYGTIYTLVDPRNGSVRYCGKTALPLPTRMYGHRTDARAPPKRGHRRSWLRSLYRDGVEPEMHTCEIVFFTPNERDKNRAALSEAETRWIAELKGRGFDLVNETSGGDGGHGRVPTQEQREKSRVKNLGQKRTIEACARMREARLGKPRPDLCGALHPHYGKSNICKDPVAKSERLKEVARLRSPEVRERMHKATREAQTGVPKTLTLDQITQIYAAIGTHTHVGQRFGVNSHTVSKIRRGVKYSHITGHVLGGP